MWELAPAIGDGMLDDTLARTWSDLAGARRRDGPALEGAT